MDEPIAANEVTPFGSEDGEHMVILEGGPGDGAEYMTDYPAPRIRLWEAHRSGEYRRRMWITGDVHASISHYRWEPER